MPSDTLADLLGGYEAARQGDRPQARLTASGVVPICIRQAALALQQVPPSDPVEPVTAATVGTMIHEAYTRLWRERDPDAIVEQRGKHGQPDVVRPHAAEVRDLKTVADYVMDAWDLAGGPPDDYWLQLAIYASDAGAGEGWVLVIDALDRTRGRTRTYARHYTPAYGEAAVARLEELEKALLADDPWSFEPEGSWGPEWVTQRCPWRTACGRRRAEQPHVYSDQAVLDAATEYVEASAAESAAKKRKTHAKAVLEGVSGSVGEWDVSWSERNYAERTTTYPARVDRVLSVKRAKA